MGFVSESFFPAKLWAKSTIYVDKSLRICYTAHKQGAVCAFVSYEIRMKLFVKKAKLTFLVATLLVVAMLLSSCGGG